MLLVKRMWRRSGVSCLIREKLLCVRMFGPGWALLYRAREREGSPLFRGREEAPPR